MEGSTKPRRPVFQPYIPVHRRNKTPAEETLVETPRVLPKVEPEVKRRGRGQFRAPSIEDNLTKASNTLAEKPIEETLDKPVIDLIKQVERLATGPNQGSDKKDDWEEEWEENAKVLEQAQILKKSAAIKPVEDDVLTVLDCYDLPNSFKIHDLQNTFKEYQSMNGGYTIEWVDESRALIMFEHPLTAKKAYSDLINSPFIKVRPYKGQIVKKPSAPIPRRPAKTDMVARRLINNALGVKTIKTPEQREAEKELFRKARELRHAQKENALNREKELAGAFNE